MIVLVIVLVIEIRFEYDCGEFDEGHDAAHPYDLCDWERRNMTPQFDHEKLDVYVVELEFIRWVTPLLSEARASGGSEVTEVLNHLDRASLSILLNTAEGNGKRLGRSRYKFFDDARGSGTECAACLDALVAKGKASESRIAEGKALLLRIVQMLSKLVVLSEEIRGVREDDSSYSPEEREK